MLLFDHNDLGGPNDDAPRQLALHFKNVILEFKNKSWSHFSKDKLGARKKFDPKELADNDYRTFDHSPEAFWLGEALIRRSLFVVFESIRKLYYSYKTQSLLPLISFHLGDQFIFANGHLQSTLLKAFAHLAPRQRGRKRKVHHVDASNLEDYESVLLEGVTYRKIVAVMFKWKHLPINEASWHPIDIQTPDFREWWSEEIEARYPLTPAVAYRVPLRADAPGQFSMIRD